MSILGSLYQHERAMGNRLWLTQPMAPGVVKTYSFSEALNEARRVAAYLRAQQFPAGSHIAILSKNTAHWLITDLAIWMAGHVSVPLYPLLNAASIKQILDHSKCKLIFVGKLDGWAGIRDGLDPTLPRVYMPLCPTDPVPGLAWDDVVAQHAPISDSPVPSDNAVATIIYTSGTTGGVKGAMHDFSHMEACARGIGKTLSMHPDDRMLSYLPLAHVVERWLVEITAFTFGIHVYFAESLDTFLADLQRARPTLFVSVPRLWLKFQAGVHAKMPAKKLSLLLKIPILNRVVKKKILTNLGLNHVRFAGTGSAPLAKEIFDWYRRLGLELLEGYGMTENFGYSHLGQPGRVRSGYIGQPSLGVQHRISPEGEIQVKSPGQMLGYYENPTATAEMYTEDGWLKTGDRGEIDDQDRLRITGRVKEIFKTSKGKYVAPAPIESQLVSNGLFEQACVTGSGQPQPCALVVLAEDLRRKIESGALTTESLQPQLQKHIDQINAALDSHEQLEFVAIVKQPWLPENGFLTPTLKVKRQAVEKAFDKAIESWYASRKVLLWE